MDWLNIGQVRKIEMMRLMNRISLMSESRLPKKVLRWEVINGCNAWLGEVLDVCKELEIPSPIGPYMSLYTYDIEVLEKRALCNAQEEWRQQVPIKSKLGTYAYVRDFTINAQLVTFNLPRGQRSVIAKLLCGILPIQIEVGRFNNTKWELRFCKQCSSGKIEDETHCLIDCEKFKYA